MGTHALTDERTEILKMKNEKKIISRVNASVVYNFLQR